MGMPRCEGRSGWYGAWWVLDVQLYSSIVRSYSIMVWPFFGRYLLLQLYPHLDPHSADRMFFDIVVAEGLGVAERGGHPLGGL